MRPCIYITYVHDSQGHRRAGLDAVFNYSFEIMLIMDYSALIFILKNINENVYLIIEFFEAPLNFSPEVRLICLTLILALAGMLGLGGKRKVGMVV